VSSMFTITAPDAWRAISPVSIVTVCLPQVNVFFAISNTEWIPFNIARAISPAARFADKHQPDKTAKPASMHLRALQTRHAND